MINVCELFAGVGGFRLGLEKVSDEFNFVWANQLELRKRTQHAYDCYVNHFGVENCINLDISQIDKNEIPDHDLLVGGFPCQDYSVASTGAKGIQGKKGVLWWEIRDILEAKQPKFVLLENVDILLKSPVNQRGRDFGVMLACFNDLGYSVEWRVINAAEYGFSQRRRRIFLFAFRNDTEYANRINKNNLREWIYDKGFFQEEFPIMSGTYELEYEADNTSDEQISIFEYSSISENEIDITKVEKIDSEKITMEYEDIVDISENFKMEFKNTGIMTNGVIYTEKTIPRYNGKFTLLRDILETDVDEKYYLDGDDEKLAKFKYLKGAKRIERTSKSGHSYIFNEKALDFPDSIDRPARTMLTSESSVNRSTHVVRDPQTNRLRLLTPVEAERLNGFDDNWTNSGMPERYRYFYMENALVVDLVEKMGKSIYKISKLGNKVEDSVTLKKIDTKLNEESLLKRLENIKFIEDIPRNNKLRYGIKENRLTIKKYNNNEDITIQYPGKESERDIPNIWDFRPKLESDNAHMPDLKFGDIWLEIYSLYSKLDKEKGEKAMKLISCEFYRMAYLIDYYEEEAKEYKIECVQDNNLEIYTSPHKFNIYKPNEYIINELSKITPTILNFSWESFFAYNDLIALNEDCKYYYQKYISEINKEIHYVELFKKLIGEEYYKKLSKELKGKECYKKLSKELKAEYLKEKCKTELHEIFSDEELKIQHAKNKAEKYIKSGVGRRNNLFTHIGFIKSMLSTPPFIDNFKKFVSGRGVAAISQKDLYVFLEEYFVK